MEWCRFELAFPLDERRKPAIDTTLLERDVPADIARLESIFIIDDNVQLMDAMEQLVQYHGYKCFTARTAEEARSKMGDINHVDAVFIDLSMPDTNGIDLGTELMERCPTSRFYLLTGEAIHEAKSRAIRCGFRGVFFKPLKVAELLQAAVT